jgi:hypothetical protein
MEEQDNKVSVFPFQRGEILTKLNRIKSLQELKESYNRICRMVESMEDVVPIKPRNPREDAIQAHSKKTLQVLKRQKMNQEEMITLLENQIRKDIEDSKKE